MGGLNGSVPSTVQNACRTRIRAGGRPCRADGTAPTVFLDNGSNPSPAVNREAPAGRGLRIKLLPDFDAQRTHIWARVRDRFPIGLVKVHQGRLDIVPSFPVI